MSHLYFLSSFESSGFGSGEKVKIEFYKMTAVAAILDFRPILAILSYKLPQYFLFESMGLSVQKRKFKFQNGGNLAFDGTILAIFDLQVTQIPPIKFRVNWHFGSGEEV